MLSELCITQIVTHKGTRTVAGDKMTLALLLPIDMPVHQKVTCVEFLCDVASITAAAVAAVTSAKLYSNIGNVTALAQFLRRTTSIAIITVMYDIRRNRDVCLDGVIGLVGMCNFG